MKSRLTLVAVVISVLGLLALIVRAEFVRQSAPSWRIAIEGYDPRDLLAGHYLRYRYRFAWTDRHTCGESLAPATVLPERAVEDWRPGCCVCLERSDPRGFDPPASWVACDEPPAHCDGLLDGAAITPPLRYFVPEARARALEHALREREAALELVISPAREPAIRQLLLDGQPWRDVLD